MCNILQADIGVGSQESIHFRGVRVSCAAHRQASPEFGQPDPCQHVVSLRGPGPVCLSFPFIIPAEACFRENALQ